MRNIYIIGGGVCGIVASYYIKKLNPNYQVTVLEKDKEVGKRIKVSGNGRCNFSNDNILTNSYSTNEVQDIINLFKKEEENFYQDINLHFYSDDEGRRYPLTNSSKTVHTLLITALKKIGVKIINNCEVYDLDDNRIYTNLGQFKYDNVVLSTGGLSYLYPPSNFDYLKKLNINIVKPSPVLCPVRVNEKIPSQVVGKRAKVVLTLLENNNEVFKEDGEIIFKKDGISGIVVFNSTTKLLSNKKYIYHLNFIKGIKKESIEKQRINFSSEEIIKSYVVDEIGEYLYSNNNNPYDALSNFKLTFKELYPFKDSQLTRGGVDLNQLNSNLSLKNHPQIYVGGELLNVIAPCGGYNIFFAMACGYYIAYNIN